MRTIRTKVYQFNELSDEAKAKAIEQFNDINVSDFEWWNNVYDTQKEILENLGFDEPEISFSGFWSQGDGASFTSDKFDFIKFNETYELIKDTRILNLIKKDEIEITGIVKRTNNHYVHERSTSLILEIDYRGDNGRYEYINIGNALNTLEDEIEQTIVRLNQDIYKALEKEHDYLTSAKVIEETIIANEYEFFKDGKRSTL